MITRLSGIIVWLTVLWLLLWDDLSVANVLSGIAIAIVIVTSARLPRLVRRGDTEAAVVRPLATARFGVYVLYKLVESNLILAWEIITPRNRINAGVIAVELRTDSDMAMMVVANVITLTPGTMTLEVTGSPPVLYVNVLHLHDIDEVRRDLLRLEELAVRAFGSSAARVALDARTTT